MQLRLFKPEFPIDDINVSKHLYPDTERVDDTDIFDSNIPTTDEVDQNENDNLDQDLVEEEPSEEIIPQVQEQHSPQVIPPEITTRIEYQQVETDHNNLRPPTVRFWNARENYSTAPPPRDERRIRVPLRDEQHENQAQQTNTQSEDEERMSSRPSRNNQSRYRLRENPTPKKYPDFLIHEITTARNSLRKTNKVNVTS